MAVGWLRSLGYCVEFALLAAVEYRETPYVYLGPDLRDPFTLKTPVEQLSLDKKTVTPVGASVQLPGDR